MKYVGPEIRDLQYVQRWGIVRTIRQQSVAEHSYYVALYVTEIIKKLGELNYTIQAIEQTILYALEHDIDEVHTGDLPAGFKKDYLIGVNFSKQRNLPQMNRDIVKLADYLEAIIFICEERRLGNKTVDLVYDDVMSNMNMHLNDFIKDSEEYRYMYDWLFDIISDHDCYIGRTR